MELLTILTFLLLVSPIIIYKTMFYFKVRRFLIDKTATEKEMEFVAERESWDNEDRHRLARRFRR